MEEERGKKVLKSKSPKVQRLKGQIIQSIQSKVQVYKGPMVPGSKGPRYFKVTFKYELVAHSPTLDG